MGAISLALTIGLVLSTLAAIAAFLITYDEWSRHYANRREPLKLAMQSAFFAFLVFAVLTVLAVAFVNRFMSD